MRKTILALALASGLGGAAHAQDTAADRDLRCAAVIHYMYATETPRSDDGFHAVLYFLGRVQAHEPKIDIGARLPQVLREVVSGPSLESEITRCAGVFSDGMDEYEKVMRPLGRVIEQLPKP